MTTTVNSRRTRRWIGLSATAMALVLTAACGGSSSGGSGTSGSATHNQADVAFASDMIPHHAQAVEMADLALTSAADSEIKTLAAAIKGAQDPEIVLMTGWLKAWGEPLPKPGGHMMAGMDAPSNGMMSDAEMKALGEAKGGEFDVIWVEMMTRHHEGAIEMAKTEQAKGQDSDAKALAGRIIDAQTAEIATMATIKSRLG